MGEIRNLAAYFCSRYPHKSELSKARLTKMVYLADWKAAIDKGHQLTTIKWVFNQFGPYVDDVVDKVRRDPDFSIDADWTVYGNRKEVIHYTGKRDPKLTSEEQEIAQFVIEKTAPLNWDAFIKLVYSTYPVVVSERGAAMNLPSIAARYKRDRSATTGATDRIAASA